MKFNISPKIFSSVVISSKKKKKKPSHDLEDK